MDMTMSLLLMPLVILALFITSSQADGIRCFRCDTRYPKYSAGCTIPFNGTTIGGCDGSQCKMSIWKDDGQFMIYFLLFTYLQGSFGTGTHRNAVPVLFLTTGTPFRSFLRATAYML